MLSKYTLQFLNVSYEKQYRNMQSSIIIQEFYIFTYFILEGYCILSMAEFIMNGKTIFVILSLVVSILSIFIYQFIKKYNRFINVVLILYQLIIAISFKIDNFLSTEEKTNNRYAWYYGFQCCFFHFYVYIQGHNFIQSSIVLSFIFAIHTSTVDMRSTSGILNFLKCILVFIIMIAVKYTYQKLIKMNFLQTIQYKKFNELLQNEVNSWTMLLSFDKLQDQIVMNWCNSQFKAKFNFQDNVTMRKFIRSLDIKHNSIENQIRILLKDSIPNQKIEFQINYQSHNYNVQLVSIENYDEELCLFLLTPIKRKGVNNVRLFLEQFIQNIFKKVILIQQKEQNQSNKSLISRYLLINQSLNMLQLIQNKLPSTKQSITSQNISEFLNKILGSNYTLNCYFQQFIQNQQLIFQYLLLIFDLILKSNRQCLPNQMNICFSRINSDLISLTLTFYLEEKEQFIDWFRNPNPDRCRSIYSSLNQVLEHQYLHKTTKDVSFNVICLKHILNQISPSNSIKIIQSFENIHVVIGIINIKN